jgi:hypothetical protein
VCLLALIVIPKKKKIIRTVATHGHSTSFIYIKVDTNIKMYNIGILAVQTPMNRYIHMMHVTS